MAKHGKKYEEAVKLVEDGKFYTPQEAVELVKKTSTVRFDATVELHMRLGIDPRHADQIVRGMASLPNGTGKPIRILVFAQGEGEKIAQDAGADFTGSDDVVKKIEEGWIDFDVALAVPEMMGKVGRLGKILGRRGLMPNPKSGTIVQAADLPRVIKEVRRGRVEFRNDKTGLLHTVVGKVSFTEEQLLENLAALTDAVVKAKPSGAKGTYVRSMTLNATMGPGVKLDVNPTLSLTVA